MTTTRSLHLTWQTGVPTGWGMFGAHLALTAARQGHRVTLEMAPDAQQYPALLAMHQPCPEGAVRVSPGGNDILTAPREDATLFVFESSAFSAAMLRSLEGRRLVVGSAWCASVCKGYGLPVTVAHQGYDADVFRPYGRELRPSDGRFRIFSGGKLEFRKGQDIVIEAFRRFHRRHPDSVLVTNWWNAWPETMRGIEARGYVEGLPVAGVVPWLVQQGIPARAVQDVGVLKQEDVAAVMRGCDVAVFPNRGEGAINMVACEALGCGLPTIVADNTGQRDLIEHSAAIPLRLQGMVRNAPAPWRDTEGWGESDPAEIVWALERVYADRSRVKPPAALSWDAVTPGLVAALTG